MKKLLLFFFLIPFFQAKAQQEDAWIYLKDKPNKTTFLNNPLTMLSQRALDRRAKLNISLDSIDVPVDNSYYNQIKNTPNITFLAKSKWSLLLSSNSRLISTCCLVLIMAIIK
mgnify:CR=1 FL=1